MSPTFSPDELRHLLEQPRPPVVVDTRSAEEWAAGHVPGAFNVVTDDLRPEDTTMEGVYALNEALDRRFRVVGHFEKVEFVVYGRRTDVATCRALWLVHYAGHLHARLLDGGVAAWEAAGGSLTSEPTESDPTHFGVRGRRELFARYDEVEAALEDDATRFVDCRSEAEWRAGSLPGARCLDAARLLDDASGRLVDPESLRGELDALGLERRTPTILVSDAGGRSAVLCLAMRALGFRKVKSFFGGLHEWNAKRGPGAR